MAHLEQTDSGNFHIRFRIGRRHYKRSLKTTSRKAANAALGQLKQTLWLIEAGHIDFPEAGDIAEFLLTGGKRAEKLAPPKTLTVRDLFEQFVAELPAGALEDTTLHAIDVHSRHFYRILGARTSTANITSTALQHYVNTRSKEPGARGRTVARATIKYELTSFRMAWKWARTQDRIDRPFPNQGLRYPKTDERQPFRTRAEIEPLVEQLALCPSRAQDLWDCLYLDPVEIREVLAIVRKAAFQPFVYAMAATAAYTGARRSELMRSQREDIDLKTGMIVMRERKANKSTRTMRTVPIVPQLADVLTEWFQVHPGGPNTFCLPTSLRKSTKVRNVLEPLTADEVGDHLKRALAKSRWNVIRGWHTFRHSFISNCATKGVDQRMIDAWVGHQTDAMRKRYRHLFPEAQQEALSRVFG